MTKLFESLNSHYKFHIIIISYIMAQTSGRVFHFGSVCDAAVRISVEPHQRARLGLDPLFFFFLFLSCFISSVQLRLVYGSPHYLFAAGIF